jgi:glycosyltransferase involved in cell wall biosynthesis
VRVAIVARNGRCLGGAETYLSFAAPALAAAGHDLAFLHEVDVPAARGPVTMPAGTPRWCIADLGGRAAADTLRRWAPDVIYAHGLVDTALERALLTIAPVVFHAHTYHGTCVSGTKMFGSPGPVPCRRRFGARCLALYHLRRCGGWHPGTMWREYRRQRRSLAFLSKCSAVVTSSRYLAAEYLNHGFPAPAVVALPLPIDDGGEMVSVPRRDARARLDAAWRLLFLGRMDRLKGGELFLRALPIVAETARRPIVVTFAGDGAARERWEAQARDLVARTAHLAIQFAGWVERPVRAVLFQRSDLLVVPSVWPEPFGLVGLEAARHGVPAAAFAVGGIPEWLEDGASGRLAPADPPTPAGLAAAITGCLRDAETYGRLSAGALVTAARFTREGYMRALCRVLDQAARALVTEAV